MTVFEKIKSMNIDEFAEWFDEHCSHETDPCITWWNKTYCDKCEGVFGYWEDLNAELEFCWCEIKGKCKFFQDMDHIPVAIEMIKLWLESEA